MSFRLGIVIDDETVLRGSRKRDPVDVVVLRSTFLNPPRGAAMRRTGDRIRKRHPDATIIPYAWHYLSFEADDGITVGSNRSLGESPGPHGHFRDTPAVEQAWEISKICAEALGTTQVVVRTPTSFSPGSLAQRRMTRFLGARPKTDPSVIWEPGGLWEPASAAIFGATLDVEVMAPAFSMTGHVLAVGSCNWLRVSGGKDAHLRSSHAEVLAYSLAEQIERSGDDEHNHLTVLFDGPRAYANLRALVQAIAFI